MPCPIEEMTPEEAGAYERDVGLAGKLLDGIYHEDRDGLVSEIEYLSDKTNPTEDEARAALARVLLAKPTRLSQGLIRSLAELFDPQVGDGVPSARRLVFETIDHQRATSIRNAQIAYFIYGLRHEWPDEYGPESEWPDGHGPEWDDVAKKWKLTRNKTYEEAIAAAVEKFGIGERHTKRIYAQNFPRGQRKKSRLKRRTKQKPKLRLVR